MRGGRAALGWAFGVIAWGCVVAPAWAGVLTRADLERAFPAPFILDEMDDQPPVWPIFRQNATQNQLVAYVHESIDLAPIPGFSGTPIDLLVALAPEVTFLDVRVVHFHEPVFIDGLGARVPIRVRQAIYWQIAEADDQVRRTGRGAKSDCAVAVIDGVAKASVTVRARFGAERLFVGKDGALTRTASFAIVQG